MVPRLWVKCTPLQSPKSIRIAVPTVMDELRFGHITRVSSGMVGMACVVLVKCPAAIVIAIN